MEKKSKNYIALNSASINALKAFEAAFSEEFSDVPNVQKNAWAMATIIHCDICRLVVAFDECKVEGIARLLCIADISVKLFEAPRWYYGYGSDMLKQIAKSKGMSEGCIKEALKKIASEHKIGNAQKLSKYRNKFGYHYDRNALSYLQQFGEEDANEFHELLMGFAKYSGDWAIMTNNLIKEGKLPI